MIRSLLIANRAEIASASILPQLIWGRGTVRRTVEGRTLACVSVDEGHYSFHVAQQLRGRDAQGCDLMPDKPRIPQRIPERLVSTIMRFSVDLDAQLCSIAVKIESIWSRRMLFAPLVPGLTSSKLPPQQDFGQAHLASEGSRAAISFACAFDHLAGSCSRFARPSTMLRMVPLPREAGGGLGRMR